MNQVAGITIERNRLGTPQVAHINLKKYGLELREFFFSKGIEVEELSYNPKFVAMIERAKKSPTVKSVRTKEELDAYLDSL